MAKAISKEDSDLILNFFSVQSLCPLRLCGDLARNTTTEFNMRRGGAPPNMKMKCHHGLATVTIRSTVDLQSASELRRLIRRQQIHFSSAKC